jgi:hypothetical protein
VADGHGAFYGEAETLFRVTTNGLLTALAPDFLGGGSGNLIRANDGWFYGTTLSGGSRFGGSIYRLNTAIQMQPLAHTNDVWNVSFNGIPGDKYQLLRAANLSGPWEALMNITADYNGFGQYNDSAPLPGSAFYRVVAP